MVTVSSDKMGKIWTLKSCVTLRGHSSAVRAVVITEEGRIATASDDGTVKVWNLDGQCLTTFSCHDGPISALALTQMNEIVSGSKDTTATVNDVDC